MSIASRGLSAFASAGDALKERKGFVVVLALGVFAERDAAEHVRCRDRGVNTQSHERVADVVLIVGELADRVRRVEELLGFSQPSRDRAVMTLPRAWRHAALAGRISRLNCRRVP